MGYQNQESEKIERLAKEFTFNKEVELMSLVYFKPLKFKKTDSLIKGWSEKIINLIKIKRIRCKNLQL